MQLWSLKIKVLRPLGAVNEEVIGKDVVMRQVLLLVVALVFYHWRLNKGETGIVRETIALFQLIFLLRSNNKA